MSAAELHDDSVFLPSSMDWIDGLVARYRATRSRMEELAALFQREDMGAALGFFMSAAQKAERAGYMNADKVFLLAPGLGALNAHYWQQAMLQTDVLDIMPAARRDEWNKMIMEHKCPEFTEQMVRDTIGDLLASRWKFFAERVDGIFRSLSSSHVTNQPQGFYTRMILNYVFTEYGSTKHEKAGVISDLRCVIAKLDGIGEPSHGTTDTILRQARENHGEWLVCDGGRLKVKAFLKGTCHLEVHPDIAVKLNVVLASLYPAAIPASFRTKQPKPPKDWPLIQRPLPREVLAILSGAELAYVATGDFQKPYVRKPNTVMFRSVDNSQARKEAEAIIEAIGGVRTKGHFEFEYDALGIVAQIVASGLIPDKRSHQFFPTPRALAEKAVDMAGIAEFDDCLEPSAGTGGLAEVMRDRGGWVTCVEVSKLHAAVLEAKGFSTINADFLAMPDDGERYDRIVMNPPFEGGRWQAHLQHASKFLADNGRLVAILPSGAKREVESWQTFSGPAPSPWRLQWHGPFDNQFPDASVSVVILVAERRSAGV